jgi:hypothetical protein
MAFRADYRGIGRLLKSPEMQALMALHAHRAKAVAEAIAPVDPTSGHPGRYKASFVVTSGVRRGHSGRAYARLSNTSPEAVYVEYGTRNNDAHHTLLRALIGISE